MKKILALALFAVAIAVVHADWPYLPHRYQKDGINYTFYYTSYGVELDVRYCDAAFGSDDCANNVVSAAWLAQKKFDLIYPKVEKFVIR